MDAQQVTSRALHDGPDVTVADDIEQQQQQQHGNLEKHATRASAATGASADEWYPEGGFKAWVVVVGSWFGLFSALGLMNTIAVFQAYTLSHQLRGYSEGNVGWIFSVYTFLAFFCGVYIGPIFDKYGPRWLVIAGVALVEGGLIFMSFSTEYWHFMISFGIMCGAGTSLLFTPCIAAVGHWFKARRGLATGVASTAGGIGGIIFPLMMTSLFEKIGYGWTTRVLALICLLTGSMGILLVRSRLPPARNATAHPDLRIFRQLPFLFAAIGLFLLEFSLFIPLAYVSTYAMHVGFSEDFAYHLLPIMNAGSVLGRVLPGYYADVFGPFNTCMFSVVLSIVACLCVWLPSGHTTAGIIIFSILFGFASGTGISVAPVCIGRLCKTQQYGRYYATAYTIVSIACLIGIPIAGSIIEANDGEYEEVIIATSVVYVGSFAFLMWAKTAKLGWKKWYAAY